MRSALLLVALVLAVATASDVVVLDESNFDSVVNGDKNVLVEFYAPWCGHCKSLEPEYEVAATAFKSISDVVIAKVDADQHKALGSRFGVKGFPTIKYFPKGSTTPEDYNAARNAEAIVNFVNDKAGVKGFVKKAPSSVRDLNTATFDKVVDGSKSVLVEFFAPWCGHCKSLAPKYEELGRIFATEKDVVIAKVDADSAAAKALGTRFEVKGFPTIKFFPKGSTTPEDYEGGREVADFVKFLNDKAGTKRLPKGGLDSTVGRLEELDALAKELATGVKQSISAELSKLAAALKGEAKTFADFYVLIANKVEKEGKSFVEKQKARLAGLIASQDISGEKRDEFQFKSNILSAFE